jgi:hypothetical protein
MVTRSHIEKLSARIEALVSTNDDGRAVFVWRNLGETDEQALERHYQCRRNDRRARHTVIISWTEDDSTAGSSNRDGPEQQSSSSKVELNRNLGVAPFPGQRHDAASSSSSPMTTRANCFVTGELNGTQAASAISSRRRFPECGSNNHGCAAAAKNSKSPPTEPYVYGSCWLLVAFRTASRTRPNITRMSTFGSGRFVASATA